MSEKQCCDCKHFGLSKDPIFRVITGICGRCGKEVGYTDKCLFEEESFDKYLAERLNEKEEIIKKQEVTIITLKRRLEKINGGYGHLTHKKGLTPNEWLLRTQERELKKKDEQISNWIEQHSKDIAKISEQQATIDKQERRIMVLENLLTNIGVKWVDDDE